MEWIDCLDSEWTVNAKPRISHIERIESTLKRLSVIVIVVVIVIAQSTNLEHTECAGTVQLHNFSDSMPCKMSHFLWNNRLDVLSITVSNALFHLIGGQEFD